MFSKKRNGVILTVVAAFLAERLLVDLPGPLWFAGVFLVVYMIARFAFSRDTEKVFAYFEDLFLGVGICLGLGILAWYADLQISVYSGKHGGPALPAVVLALVDTFVNETHEPGRR